MRRPCHPRGRRRDGHGGRGGLRRLWPQTLVGRVLALVLIGFVVAQAVTVVLHWRNMERIVAGERGQQLAVQLGQGQPQLQTPGALRDQVQVLGVLGESALGRQLVARGAHLDGRRVVLPRSFRRPEAVRRAAARAVRLRPTKNPIPRWTSWCSKRANPPSAVASHRSSTVS